MPYTIVSFKTRTTSLTPEVFEHYYDNIHLPIIKEAMESAFPLTHARYYVQRQPESTIPLVFIGTAEDVDYDMVFIMTFTDEQHIADFQTRPYRVWEVSGFCDIIESALKKVTRSYQGL
jgi:hypothetical protein